MENWIQYHNPDVMSYGVDHVGGPPFSVLSDKVIAAPHDAIIWLTGRRAAIDGGVYLAGWVQVDEVLAAPVDAGFLYEYVGATGAKCNPMPDIRSAPWYQDLLKLTSNFHHGLTRVRSKKINKGLAELATACGAAPPAG